MRSKKSEKRKSGVKFEVGTMTCDFKTKIVVSEKRGGRHDHCP